MTWNVSDINRRPPPVSEPTRPFIGEDDPLAVRIVGLARTEARRVGTDVEWALRCLANSAPVVRRPV